MITIGERFQFYVKTEIVDNPKDTDNTIVAIHDQWCFGGRAVKYGTILLNYLRDTDWSNMYFLNNDLKHYIQSILQVRWHNPDEDTINGIKHYYHRVSIENMEYSPDRADTNHGCLIVLVRLKGSIKVREIVEIKASFFDAEGGFLSAVDMNNSASLDAKSLTDEEVSAIEEYNKLTEEDYVNLCKEMAKLAEQGDKK